MSYHQNRVTPDGKPTKPLLKPEKNKVKINVEMTPKPEKKVTMNVEMTTKEAGRQNTIKKTGSSNALIPQSPGLDRNAKQPNMDQETSDLQPWEGETQQSMVERKGTRETVKHLIEDYKDEHVMKIPLGNDQNYCQCLFITDENHNLRSETTIEQSSNSQDLPIGRFVTVQIQEVDKHDVQRRGGILKFRDLKPDILDGIPSNLNQTNLPITPAGVSSSLALQSEPSHLYEKQDDDNFKDTYWSRVCSLKREEEEIVDVKLETAARRNENSTSLRRHSSKLLNQTMHAEIVAWSYEHAQKAVVLNKFTVTRPVIRKQKKAFDQVLFRTHGISKNNAQFFFFHKEDDNGPFYIATLKDDYLTYTKQQGVDQAYKKYVDSLQINRGSILEQYLDQMSKFKEDFEDLGQRMVPDPALIQVGNDLCVVFTWAPSGQDDSFPNEFGDKTTIKLYNVDTKKEYTLFESQAGPKVEGEDAFQTRKRAMNTEAAFFVDCYTSNGVKYLVYAYHDLANPFHFNIKRIDVSMLQQVSMKSEQGELVGQFQAKDATFLTNCSKVSGMIDNEGRAIIQFQHWYVACVQLAPQSLPVPKPPIDTFHKNINAQVLKIDGKMYIAKEITRLEAHCDKMYDHYQVVLTPLTDDGGESTDKGDQMIFHFLADLMLQPMIEDGKYLDFLKIVPCREKLYGSIIIHSNFTQEQKFYAFQLVRVPEEYSSVPRNEMFAPVSTISRVWIANYPLVAYNSQRYSDSIIIVNLTNPAVRGVQNGRSLAAVTQNNKDLPIRQSVIQFRDHDFISFVETGEEFSQTITMLLREKKPKQTEDKVQVRIFSINVSNILNKEDDQLELYQLNKTVDVTTVPGYVKEIYACDNIKSVFMTDTHLIVQYPTAITSRNFRDNVETPPTNLVGDDEVLVDLHMLMDKWNRIYFVVMDDQTSVIKRFNTANGIAKLDTLHRLPSTKIIAFELGPKQKKLYFIDEFKKMRIINLAKDDENIPKIDLDPELVDFQESPFQRMALTKHFLFREKFIYNFQDNTKVQFIIDTKKGEEQYEHDQSWHSGDDDDAFISTTKSESQTQNPTAQSVRQQVALPAVSSDEDTILQTRFLNQTSMMIQMRCIGGMSQQLVVEPNIISRTITAINSPQLVDSSQIVFLDRKHMIGVFKLKKSFFDRQFPKNIDPTSPYSLLLFDQQGRVINNANIIGSPTNAEIQDIKIVGVYPSNPSPVKMNDKPSGKTEVEINQLKEKAFTLFPGNQHVILVLKVSTNPKDQPIKVENEQTQFYWVYRKSPTETAIEMRFVMNANDYQDSILSPFAQLKNFSFGHPQTEGPRQGFNVPLSLVSDMMFIQEKNFRLNTKSVLMQNETLFSATVKATSVLFVIQNQLCCICSEERIKVKDPNYRCDDCSEKGEITIPAFKKDPSLLCKIFVQKKSVCIFNCGVSEAPATTRGQPANGLNGEQNDDLDFKEPSFDEDENEVDFANIFEEQTNVYLLRPPLKFSSVFEGVNANDCMKIGNKVIVCLRKAQMVAVIDLAPQNRDLGFFNSWKRCSEQQARERLENGYEFDCRIINMSTALRKNEHFSVCDVPPSFLRRINPINLWKSKLSLAQPTADEIQGQLVNEYLETLKEFWSRELVMIYCGNSRLVYDITNFDKFDELDFIDQISQLNKPNTYASTGYEIFCSPKFNQEVMVRTNKDNSIFVLPCKQDEQVNRICRSYSFYNLVQLKRYCDLLNQGKKKVKFHKLHFSTLTGIYSYNDRSKTFFDLFWYQPEVIKAVSEQVQGMSFAAKAEEEENQSNKEVKKFYVDHPLIRRLYQTLIYKQTDHITVEKMHDYAKKCRGGTTTRFYRFMLFRERKKLLYSQHELSVVQRCVYERGCSSVTRQSLLSLFLICKEKHIADVVTDIRCFDNLLDGIKNQETAPEYRIFNECFHTNRFTQKIVRIDINPDAYQSFKKKETIVIGRNSPFVNKSQVEQICQDKQGVLHQLLVWLCCMKKEKDGNKSTTQGTQQQSAEEHRKIDEEQTAELIPVWVKVSMLKADWLCIEKSTSFNDVFRTFSENYNEHKDIKILDNRFMKSLGHRASSFYKSSVIAFGLVPTILYCLTFYYFTTVTLAKEGFNSFNYWDATNVTLILFLTLYQSIVVKSKWQNAVKRASLKPLIFETLVLITTMILFVIYGNILISTQTEVLPTTDAPNAEETTAGDAEGARLLDAVEAEVEPQTKTIEYLRVAYSFHVILVWYQIVLQLRIFQQMSFYLKLLLQTFKDIKYIIIIYVLLLFMFGNAIQILNQNREQINCNDDESKCLYTHYFGFGPLDSMFGMFLSSVGEFTLDPIMEGGDEQAIVILFFASAVVTTIVVLNLIIAIMGNTFGEVNDQKEVYQILTVSDFIAITTALEPFLEQIEKLQIWIFDNLSYVFDVDKVDILYQDYLYTIELQSNVDQAKEEEAKEAIPFSKEDFMEWSAQIKKTLAQDQQVRQSTLQQTMAQLKEEIQNYVETSEQNLKNMITSGGLPNSYVNRIREAWRPNVKTDGQEE